MGYLMNAGTLNLLKNFSKINPSVVLKAGKTQRTILQESFMAVADFPEEWPKDTALYDLNVFLGMVTLFDKPDIDFGEEKMVITSAVGKASKVNYRYSDPTTVKSPGERILPTSDPYVSFTLTERDLTGLKKAAALLKSTDVVLQVVGTDVVLTTVEAKNPTCHGYEVTIPWTTNTGDYKDVRHFKVEHFNLLLDGSYDVFVRDWKYIFMKHTTVPIEYYVARQVQQK